MITLTLALGWILGTILAMIAISVFNAVDSILYRRRIKRHLRNGLLLLLFSALPVMAALPVGQLRTNVTFSIGYPANELSTNLFFKFYSTTNLALPVTQWPVYALVPATNLIITLPIDANQRLFVVTASNWWGESFFSNQAGTEPLPRSTSLTIGP